MFSFTALIYCLPILDSGEVNPPHDTLVLSIHSLDFSDDSVSTTTGRPSAWTIRYSAPEVLDSEPRNRASDIFSLGCVLVEMVS